MTFIKVSLYKVNFYLLSCSSGERARGGGDGGGDGESVCRKNKYTALMRWRDVATPPRPEQSICLRNFKR